MATTSPLLRIPLPQSTDTDQVPADLLTQTAAAETYWVGRFASAAERTTYLTAASLGTGIRGMLSWVDAPGRYETHAGTGWAPLIESTLQTDAFALTGTNWDGITPLRRISQRSAVTVGASGLFTVALSPAYPNGLLWASISLADNTGGVGLVMPVISIHSIAQLGGQAFAPGGAVVASGSNIIVGYDTIGW